MTARWSRGHDERVAASVYADTDCSAQVAIDDDEEEAGRDDDDDDEKEMAEKGQIKRGKF